MPLINCKFESKFKWNCVLSVAGANDDDPNPNKVVFTIKDYVPVFKILAKDNQKLSKLPSKAFEISVCRNE